MQEHMRKQKELELNPIIQAAQQKLNEMGGVIQGLTNENTQLKVKVKYLEEKIKQLITDQIQERIKMTKANNII
jgi:predicted RNase H-like nuclease (RuvC/YqgF family)